MGGLPVLEIISVGRVLVGLGLKMGGLVRSGRGDSFLGKGSTSPLAAAVNSDALLPPPQAIGSNINTADRKNINMGLKIIFLSPQFYTIYKGTISYHEHGSGSSIGS